MARLAASSKVAEPSIEGLHAGSLNSWVHHIDES